MSNFSQFLPTTNLTSNVTGTLPVANGGTGAATLTANNVLLGNGTSALQAVAPGTTGNVLTSNGSTWASTAPAGGGSWVYLSTVTANNATTADIESTFNSTYDMYAIVFYGFASTGGSTDAFRMRFKTDGIYQTSGYMTSWAATNSTALGANESSISEFRINNTQVYLPWSATSYNSSGIVYIPNPSNTNKQKYIFGTYQSGHPTPRVVSFGCYNDQSTSALTGLRFYTDNNLNGTFRLYGIKNS